MDIQKIIKELLEKITEDEKLQESFKKNGIKTVEKLLNIDLPDDQIEKIAMKRLQNELKASCY